MSVLGKRGSESDNSSKHRALSKGKKGSSMKSDAPEDLLFTYFNFIPNGKHYFYFIKGGKYFCISKKYPVRPFKNTNL